MAAPINLNKFRKRKARQEREKGAEKNRLEHGRTKAERAADAARRARTERELAGKKLESGPEGEGED